MDAQREVANRLQSSTETLRQLSQQVGEMQKMGQDLSQATQTMQSILGGAKSRGIFGEATLEKLLEDALPRAVYEMQFRFGTGDIVDAIIRIEERILCIDSKFPLDSYRRFLESGEDHRREFAVAVKQHADSICKKYILPDEHTLDYALMFVPSESVYYEMLKTEDGKGGRLDDYCRARHVLAVSPNTCFAYLGAIATSLRGMKVEENARKLMASLAGLEKQMELFVTVFDKLGTHLRNAGQSYEDADSRLQRARGTLEQMSEGNLPDALPPQRAGKTAGSEAAGLNSQFRIAIAASRTCNYLGTSESRAAVIRNATFSGGVCASTRFRSCRALRVSGFFRSRRARIGSSRFVHTCGAIFCAAIR